MPFSETAGVFTGLCVAVGALGGVGSAWAQASPAAVSSPLVVCMSEDNAPQSWVGPDRQVRGFEVLISEAVAAELGRPLRVVPFESKYEKDSSLTHEVNALLSSGVCDLVSGFPLIRSDLGPPTRDVFKTPDYPGAKRKPQRPWVALGTLAASEPYQSTTFSVVLAREGRSVKTLADLRGVKTGVVTGTLAGTAMVMYRNGLLRPDMVTLTQREDRWAALGSDRIEALVTQTAAFDAYRLQQPGTPFVASGFQHSTGLNLGFVALQEQQPLLQAANRVIGAALQDGRMGQWAQAAGLSWLPPSKPAVMEQFSLEALLDDLP